MSGGQRVSRPWILKAKCTTARGRAPELCADFLKTKRPRAIIVRGRWCGARSRLGLRGGGVLAIQFRTQTIKVRIEGNETGQALEKRGAASFMRNAIQRTLTVTRRQKTATGQTYRGRIERIDRDVAPLCFFDRAIDVERLPCARRIEAAGNIQPVGNKQYRVWAFPA